MPMYVAPFTKLLPIYNFTVQNARKTDVIRRNFFCVLIIQTIIKIISGLASSYRYGLLILDQFCMKVEWDYTIS